MEAVLGPSNLHLCLRDGGASLLHIIQSHPGNAELLGRSLHKVFDRVNRHATKNRRSEPSRQKGCTESLAELALSLRLAHGSLVRLQI